jgi:hypothetical protein
MRGCKDTYASCVQCVTSCTVDGVRGIQFITWCKSGPIPDALDNALCFRNEQAYVTTSMQAIFISVNLEI